MKARGDEGGYHKVPLVYQRAAAAAMAPENGSSKEFEAAAKSARRRKPKKPFAATSASSSGSSLGFSADRFPGDESPSCSEAPTCNHNEGSIRRFKSPTKSRQTVLTINDTQHTPPRLARRNSAPLYSGYWEKNTVDAHLKTGAVFSCSLRINMHNRQEGYASVEGVPTDILVDGEVAQNRAVEGDVVALTIDAPIHWPKLKGFNNANGRWNGSNKVDAGSSSPSTSANKDSSFEGSAIVNGRISSGSAGSDTTSPGVENLKAWLKDMPGRRPTGKVVAVLKESHRRTSLVGFLSRKNSVVADGESLMFTSIDPKFPKMVVRSSDVPAEIARRLQDGDSTVWSELMAAYIHEWNSNCPNPNAVITRSMGQAGEVEAQTAAILFEHAVHSAEFPSEVLACLPRVPWKIPPEEVLKRRDLRQTRIFSIDPVTARDLDDALSIEHLEDGLVRIGVHISDVSYFVHPGAKLDEEAQHRSTSVYMSHQVLPMLPRLLCEELCSLNPGVDRLAFSVLWDVDSSGGIVNQWLGRSIIRSCCKMSYDAAQSIIDGDLEAELPEVSGGFSIQELIKDIKILHEIASQRRKDRFENGALSLDLSKITFLLDEDGSPYESKFYERQESSILVEELMLLANKSVARIVSTAFPDSALLRRHPEPNERKLKEFDDFCSKHGFLINTKSAATFHSSLEKLKEELKDDPVLMNVVLVHAAKPMQVAKYFCTGGLDEDKWAHYSLASSSYTHFTSPIRRYPDIVVHRMLSAALEAEQEVVQKNLAACVKTKFEALQSAATKYKIPETVEVEKLAAHSNLKKMSAKNVQDAADRLFLWSMLRKKPGLLSDACVLGVRPKFMTLYVCKIAMERRLYYEDVDSLKVEWLENTGTLVLDYAPPKRKHLLQHGKSKPFLEVAEVEDGNGIGEESATALAAEALPLTLRTFSRIPVLVYAVGGENKAVDIGVKLYVSSYLVQ